MNTRLRKTLVLGALASFPAFFPALPAQAQGSGPGHATVTVRNHRKVEVTLHVDEGEFDIRVGTVPAGQEKTLLLPSSITERKEEVEQFVHTERGIDLVSHFFALNRGAHPLVNVPAS